MNQITKFKQELRDLLDKYDAEISFDFDGDTHGIYDERVSISVNRGTETEIVVDYQSYLVSGDL